MDYNDFSMDAMKYAGDFWFPTYDSLALFDGGGNGKSKRQAGQEQIKHKDKNWRPEIIENNDYDYPRIQKFFEWEQFLDYCDWDGAEHRRRSHWTGETARKHTGTYDFQQAMDLARYGWVDGLKQIDKFEKLEFPTRESFQQNYEIQTQYDIAGGSVNIGRYLSGMPDCMRRMNVSKAHNLPARVQKIIAIIGYNIGTYPFEIMQHGYKVYQIINALEMANIQTDITLAHAANKWYRHNPHDNYMYETYIKIKDSTDIIYPEKVLFCVAHPAMLRRLIFSEQERNSHSIRATFHFYWENGEWGYGHGYKEWCPPFPMMKDTLIIPSFENTAEMNELIVKVQNLINSQYEQTR